MADSSDQMLGGGVSDLVSTQKTGVQNLGRAVQSLANAFPPATASTSPVATGLNSLGTTGTTVLVVANPNRHGILFHNPGATATIYAFPTTMTSVPTSTTLGGAIGIAIGSTVFLPSAQFPNINCGFTGFAGTGSNQPFTVWEFF